MTLSDMKLADIEVALTKCGKGARLLVVNQDPLDPFRHAQLLAAALAAFCVKYQVPSEKFGAVAETFSGTVKGFAKNGLDGPQGEI